MKRLFLLILLGVAAWYGYKNYKTVFEKRDGHDVVIENSTGRTMVRVRVIVDGQTLVKETLPDGQKATEVRYESRPSGLPLEK